MLPLVCWSPGTDRVPVRDELPVDCLAVELTELGKTKSDPVSSHYVCSWCKCFIQPWTFCVAWVDEITRIELDEIEKYIYMMYIMFLRVLWRQMLNALYTKYIYASARVLCKRYWKRSSWNWMKNWLRTRIDSTVLNNRKPASNTNLYSQFICLLLLLSLL